MHKKRNKEHKENKKKYTLTTITKQQNKISTLTQQPYPGNSDKLSKECHKLRRNRF